MLLLLAMLACTGGSAPAGPPVVALVTVDTWRLDHLSAAHSPHLWALAEQGTRFTDAWSPVGLTTAAHATMLTGAQPWEHGARANNHHGYALIDGPPRIHERLGLRAGAFVSAFPAGPEGGLDRGFERFSGPESGERPGAIAVAEALAWLPTDASAFVWVHVYEPHGPYEGVGATDVARYGEEVRRADAALAPLLDALVARGGRIVVAADHGEVLTEEGCGYQHARSSHEAVLHVPLFTWPRLDGQAVIDDRVTLADVPTLLEGRRPAARPVVVGESGECDPGCAPGCAPSGVQGRDTVGRDGAGLVRRRPGVGRTEEGHPSEAVRAAVDAVPPVPLPGATNTAEAKALGYLE